MKTIMNGLCAVAISSLGFLAAPVAVSDTVTIPLGQQGDHWNIQRPKTGITKEQVITQYGSPEAQQGPVGSPSIYIWTYPHFKVFFEDDHVIHSVVVSP